ncbi:Pentatricopeptide repeat-containing protein mitochondrial [Spatholobus suberectus]|nr:Pentatricopeptide repeat-containing protein mitochondrial [Spatholobus suberectus]
MSEKGWLYMVTLTANNPSEICREMRKKGYASKIVVQRSTEEESLHIIKFWWDFDTEVNETDQSASGFIGSLLTQIPLFSYWRGTSMTTSVEWEISNYNMAHKTLVSWTTMVLGYARFGFWMLTRELLYKIPEKSVVPWNAIISGCVQAKNNKEALALFHEMQVSK